MELICYQKYLIGERNVKKKVYDLYQKYLIGERNGKGKEYNLLELINAQKYLIGERNGKGKEYFKDDDLKFEGEYLNGKGKEVKFLIFA